MAIGVCHSVVGTVQSEGHHSGERDIDSVVSLNRSRAKARHSAENTTRNSPMKTQVSQRRSQINAAGGLLVRT